MNRWWRISSPYFVAGLRVEGGQVVEAAPILGWTVGNAWSRVRTYLQDVGYHGEPLGVQP